MYKLTGADLKPKNRTPNKLFDGSKELQHAAGSIINKWPEWFSVLVLNQELITELKPLPATVSILSGEPAIIYRSGGEGIEIPLTPREALRYIAYSLKPEEYFKLMVTYGDHDEISEEFYWRDEGDSKNPCLSRIAFHLAEEKVSIEVEI